MPIADNIPARTAWAEARDQGSLGLRAVLSTIANRAQSPGWWGTDLDSVCLAPWQFSCWNAGDPNREKLLAVDESDPVFAACIQFENSLRLGVMPDTVSGADSYYNPKIVKTPPAWTKGRKPVCTIGAHVFYKIGLHGDGK